MFHFYLCFPVSEIECHVEIIRELSRFNQIESAAKIKRKRNKKRENNTVRKTKKRQKEKARSTALWSRITKNPDVSTKPLARLFPHCSFFFPSLCSRTPLYSLICLLAYSLTPELMGE